jgi:hypothetical protein
LGWPAFLDFLRYPLVGGVATYFMALAHLLMLLAGIRLLYLAKKEGGAKFLRMPSGTQTGELVNALFLAVGGLMTLGCFRIYQHYLIMSFPLEFVWFAWIGSQAPRGGSRHLTLVLIAQLLISAAFLVYIHVNHGIPQADYGTAFQFQTP